MRRKSLELGRISTLKLVQTSRWARRFATCLVLLLGLSSLLMALLPWQQSARGAGRVVAYDPQQRQQTVTAQVKGVVASIAEGLVDGTRVKQGDPLIEIEPTASNLVDQLTGSKNDLMRKMKTAEVKADVYGQNIIDLEEAKRAVVASALELIEAARNKALGKESELRAAEAKEEQARVNLERQQGLNEQGLRSDREVEVLQRDWEVAVASLENAQRALDAANAEVSAKEFELIQKEREAKTKVNYARAMQQDAFSQIAQIQKEMRTIAVKLDELTRNKVEAPIDGIVLRLRVFARGQSVKEGDELLTIVPEVSDQAVELWISGNDIPLVSIGSHVRLQFEGWPAVQFAGWPSVAVGTFGGEIAAIDASDDGTGRFRVLVRPTDELEWPSEDYLRQGVRANGWVMLGEVSIGYEIWRQLNGFPPSVSQEASKEEDKLKPSLAK